MKDLININNKLSSLLRVFVEEIAEKDSFDVAQWLEENDIRATADIRLLQNYAQRTFQLFRKTFFSLKRQAQEGKKFVIKNKNEKEKLEPLNKNLFKKLRNKHKV